jgi:uncharacterized protein (TIGR02996 family)
VTTEDDFQSALDKDPEDWQTRLVFADWLQEHNDLRAEGCGLKVVFSGHVCPLTSRSGVPQMPAPSIIRPMGEVRASPA